MSDTALSSPPTVLVHPLRLRLWAWVVRHPVLTVAIIAFAARMFVALGLVIVGATGLVEDDQAYVAIVRGKLDGTLDALDPYYQDLYSATWAFTEPLTLATRVFGHHVFAGQVVVVLWGTLTAVATTMIALRLLSSRGLAVLAGLVPAVLPSQILWSSVWLKDAAVTACLALVVLGLVIAMRRRDRWNVGAGVVTTAFGLCGLSGLRLNSFVLACWCVAVVLIFFYWRRPSIVVTAALLVAVIPWAGGAGILGSHALSRGDALGTQRMAGAANADSALIAAPPPSATTSVESPAADDFASNLRYLPRGLVAVLLRPYPWEASTSRASTFAKLDNLIWYFIAGLGIVGLWTVRRRREFALIVLLIAGTIGVYALAEGNLGTAFRHRGEVVWAVGLLACAFLDRRTHRNQRPPDTTATATGELAGSPE
jgi:hypothetical protein